MSFTPYGTDSKLDKLVDSNRIEDQAQAFQKNYGFDKLIKTSVGTGLVWGIIETGYGLDVHGKHLNTESSRDAGFRDEPIECAIWEYLETHGYDSLEQWIERNPDKCVFDKQVA